MKTNLTARMVSLILAIVLLIGVMPTAAFATEEEATTTTSTENVETVPVGDEENPVTEEATEETDIPIENDETIAEPADDATEVITPVEQEAVNATAIPATESIVNVTLGRRFTMGGNYYNVLASHSEFGNKDYLAYEWSDELAIWFFDDLSDVKFFAWDRAGNNYNTYFGIRPSKDVQVTVYLHDRVNLELRSVENKTFEKSNWYSFTYSFISSFDIYWDNSFNRDDMFYDLSGTLPAIDVPSTASSIQNISNDKNFILQDKFAWLLQSKDEYGTKEYLTYEWNDDIRIWFFDNIDNVNFHVYEKFGDNYNTYFGIRPSADVTFTEYVYNKNTLKFKRVEERSFGTSNVFTFIYPFMASFNIYMDESYGDSFYNPNKNVAENPIKNSKIDIESRTNGVTFTVPGEKTWLVTYNEECKGKNYIAYEWGNEFIILFFENIQNVVFTVCNQQTNSFQIKPSREVQLTEYRYDKYSNNLKSVITRTMGPSNMFSYSYNFMANFSIYTDEDRSEYFYRVLGNPPTLQSPPTQAKNITGNNTFTMQDEYYALIEKSPSFKYRDYYLAYTWQNKVLVWFFYNDLNVKFNVWDRRGDNYSSGYFGIEPAADVRFTEYVYNKNTLELKEVNEKCLYASNWYSFMYNFVTNLDIYTDKNYNNYFYRAKENNPIINRTNGRTFIMPSMYYMSIEALRMSGNINEYMAYVKDGKLVLLAFDSLNDIEFYPGVGTYSFNMNPSKDVTCTEYVYNENMSLEKETEKTIKARGGYTIPNFNFMASFDIYTNYTHNALFFEVANTGHANENWTFNPLSKNEADEFLRFITGVGAFYKLEEKIPQYYKLLTGEITDPDEEKRTKLAFLLFYNCCMETQLRKSGIQRQFAETYFIKWLDGKIGFLGIPLEEMQSEAMDSLSKTFDFHGTPVDPGTLQYTDVVSFVTSYADVLVNIAGIYKTLVTRGELNYLIGYRDLLNKTYEGDDNQIFLAEQNCLSLRQDILRGGSPERMERYAKYIFAVERSFYN